MMIDQDADMRMRLVGIENQLDEMHTRLQYIEGCMRRIMPLVERAETMLSQTPLQRIRAGLLKKD